MKSLSQGLNGNKLGLSFQTVLTTCLLMLCVTSIRIEYNPYHRMQHIQMHPVALLLDGWVKWEDETLEFCVPALVEHPTAPTPPNDDPFASSPHRMGLHCVGRTKRKLAKRGFGTR